MAAGAICGAIILLAVLCRTVYFMQLRGTPLCAAAVGPDVQEYDAWAREILGGCLLWRHLHIHAPFYPYLLAAMYRLTGVDVCAVRALQLGAGVVSMVLMCLATRRVGGTRPALILGVLWALYMPLIYYSAELVSEGALVLCLSSAFCLWTAIFRPRPEAPAWQRPVCLAGFGICLGLAAVTHPLSLLFGVAFLGCAAWIEGCAGGPRRGIRAGAIAAAFMLLPVTAVVARNAAVTGELTPIQARAGLNFYIGNNPEANGTCYVRPGPAYDLLLRWPAEEGAVGNRAVTRFYCGEVWTFIRGAPHKWLGLLGRKLLLTWQATELPSGPDLPELQVLTPFMRLPGLRFGVVAPLAFAGIWLCRRKRWALPFVLCVGCYTVMLTLFVTSGRYRLGMVPAVLALAALGVDQLLVAWREDKRRDLIAGTAVVGLGALVAFVPAPALPGSSAESAEILAEAEWRNGHPDLAGRWLAKALHETPDHPGRQHLMGVLLAEAGRSAPAIAHYREALALDPRNARTRVDLAVALAESGAAEEAETELNAALELDATSAEAFYNLGVLAEKRGDPDAAAEHYRRALQHKPALTSAHLNYAVLCHRARRHADAWRHYRAALRLEPDKVRTLNCVAVFKAETGAGAQAAAYFRRSLLLAPDQGDVWVAYSKLLAGRGDAAGAAASLRQAVR